MSAFFLIVSETDGPDWAVHEVHGTMTEALAAAEAWLVTDRSHGGRPYTWSHIIEQAGADVLRQWDYDEWQQVWVSTSPAIVVHETAPAPQLVQLARERDRHNAEKGSA